MPQSTAAVVAWTARAGPGLPSTDGKEKPQSGFGCVMASSSPQVGSVRGGFSCEFRVLPWVVGRRRMSDPDPGRAGGGGSEAERPASTGSGLRRLRGGQIWVGDACEEEGVDGIRTEIRTGEVREARIRARVAPRRPDLNRRRLQEVRSGSVESGMARSGRDGAGRGEILAGHVRGKPDLGWGRRWRSDPGVAGSAEVRSGLGKLRKRRRKRGGRWRGDVAGSEEGVAGPSVRR